MYPACHVERPHFVRLACTKGERECDMKSSYRWVIVAAGALMTCVGIGAMFSLAIFLAADVGRHRLVARRHFERDDARLPGDGRCRLRLGRAQRPLRRAHRRADRRRAARARAGAGEPRHLADAIPAHLRHAGRSCRQRLLRADDRDRHRLVRGQPQPRGIAGLRRHGRGADDDLALRALADLDL